MLPLWKYSLKKITNLAPSDWRIIQLCNLICNNNTSLFIKNEICYSTVAYLINVEGQKQIINIFKNNTFIFDKYPEKNTYKLNADEFIYPLVNNYYTMQSLFFTDNKKMDSTIHKEDTLDHIKSSIEIINNYIKNPISMENL